MHATTEGVFQRGPVRLRYPLLTFPSYLYTPQTLEGRLKSSWRNCSSNLDEQVQLLQPLRSIAVVSPGTSGQTTAGKRVPMLGKWPFPNKLSGKVAPAGGLWIRRVLVRAQEGQLKARWLLTSQRAFSLWRLPILTYTASERLVKLKLWILMAGMAA